MPEGELNSDGPGSGGESGSVDQGLAGRYMAEANRLQKELVKAENNFGRTSRQAERIRDNMVSARAAAVKAGFKFDKQGRIIPGLDRRGSRGEYGGRDWGNDKDFH